METKTLTNSLRAEAINWIMECPWPDVESREDIEELSDLQIIKAINYHYDGGLDQFIKDGEL